MNDFNLSAYRGGHVLITGGLGFIGSNLTHRLVNLGAKVTILDHMATKQGGNLKNFEGIESNITVVVDDIRNVDVLRRLIVNADFVFNLAGQVSYTESMVDPQLDFDISCMGQLALLEACRLKNTRARIIFASSRMVYRRSPPLPVSEVEVTEPLTIYGIHKLTSEHYHRLYASTYGMPTVSLRITNPYGPRQRATTGKYGLVNWFLKLASRGEPLSIFGDGKQLRDYIYIEDLVEIFLRVGLLPNLSGQVFNAGKGEGTTFLQMAEAVLKAAGRGALVFVDWPENYSRFETGDFVPDVSRVMAEIRYQPSVSLSEGLKRTVDYYEAKGGWE